VDVIAAELIVLYDKTIKAKLMGKDEDEKSKDIPNREDNDDKMIVKMGWLKKLIKGVIAKEIKP